MKKLLWGLAITVSLFFAVIAQASTHTYTFQSNDKSSNTADMMDLAHDYYYGWGISNDAFLNLQRDLIKGDYIVSATLTYNNIWNWQYNEKGNQLASFLLADAPAIPGVQTLPVTINNVPQGHNLFTYTKTTYIYTKTIYTFQEKVYTYSYNKTFSSKQSFDSTYTETINCNKNGKIVSYTYKKTETGTSSTAPSGFTVASSQTLTKTQTNDSTVPTGYKLTNTQTSTKTSINTQLAAPGDYKLTNTQTSTKTSTSSTPPIGYVLSASKFIQDMVTSQAGISLSNNLWERYDGSSKDDVNWGTASTLIGVWSDTQGGQPRNPAFSLTYNFDDNLIDELYKYAMTGSLGFGIDPDCHYYNDGVTFKVTVDSVPEPTTVLLLVLGLFGLAEVRRRSGK